MGHLRVVIGIDDQMGATGSVVFLVTATASIFTRAR